MNADEIWSAASEKTLIMISAVRHLKRQWPDGKRATISCHPATKITTGRLHSGLRNGHKIAVCDIVTRNLRHPACRAMMRRRGLQDRCRRPRLQYKVMNSGRLKVIPHDLGWKISIERSEGIMRLTLFTACVWAKLGLLASDLSRGTRFISLDNRLMVLQGIFVKFHAPSDSNKKYKYINNWT